MPLDTNTLASHLIELERARDIGVKRLRDGPYKNFDIDEAISLVQFTHARAQQLDIDRIWILWRYAAIAAAVCCVLLYSGWTCPCALRETLQR